MNHPFAELIGLKVVNMNAGGSLCTLEVKDELHMNPHGVVHGAVLYALADTGMGAAVYPTLSEGESCTTIEVKMSYIRPAKQGPLRCETRCLNRGRKVAYFESSIYADEKLLAHATGSFAIVAAR